MGSFKVANLYVFAKFRNAHHLQAYGIVWRAIDKKSNEVVALKKIFDAFQNATDAQVVLLHFISLCKRGDTFCIPLKPKKNSPSCNTVLIHKNMMQRTFREIMFLQELNNHENIVK